MTRAEHNCWNSVLSRDQNVVLTFEQTFYLTSSNGFTKHLCIVSTVDVVVMFTCIFNFNVKLNCGD